jgi:hypothetical protein
MSDLFTVPTTWPAWYRPRRERATSNQRVARGRHPNGLPLGPEGATCRGCALRYQPRRRGASWKCETMGRDTCGPASDLVLAWRACERFEPRTVGP